MNKQILLFILLLFSFTVQAQTFKVQGKALNIRMEPLSYATIQVKEFETGGLITKQDGSYELQLVAGTYHLLVTAIGYKSQEVVIVVNNDLQKDITLEEEAQSLGEVIVKARSKDRAEEIMRQVVRKKDSIQAAAGPYSCNVYIKAIEQPIPNKKTDKAKPTDDDWKNMSMAEIVLKLDVASENRIKEQRLGVRQNGNTSRLFYLSVTDGNFNFYNNLIKVPNISPTPFLSPISYSGLIAYKFKTIKVKRSGKHRIYTLSVKPLEVTNATVEGEITVSDSAWVVLHSRFRFPEYHLQEFDFFEVEQEFGFVDSTAWMMTRQEFTYYSKGRSKTYTGNTVATFSNFELNRPFAKRYFGTEVSATAKEAYQKDDAFWKTVRTLPMHANEERFIQYRDSLSQIARSEAYLDSIDRRISKFTWMKLGFFGQSLHDHRKERTWHFSPLSSIYRPFAFGGGRLGAYASYAKTFPNRKSLQVNLDASYGLRNSDINGSIEVYRKYDAFHNGSYSLMASREFAFIADGDAMLNRLKRDNVYLNNYMGIGQSREIANGLYIISDARIALRRSVVGYLTGKLVDSLLSNVLNDNKEPVAFKPYNALYGKLAIEYTPQQRYRREPNEKIILGSKWPTLYVQWEKGISGALSSDVDFDYVEFGLKQMINFGLLGISKYTIKTGDYLNKANLRLIDYKYMRRGDPLLFMDPHKAFQAVDSTFPVLNRYVEAHLFHQFNGLFINKIPLLKKLKLREVAGTGFLLAPERDLRYIELFAGIERAFESPFNPLDKFKVGLYVVGASANQFKSPVQFKLGFTTWSKRRNQWR